MNAPARALSTAAIVALATTTVSANAVAAPAATTPNTYRHGLYAQAHWTTTAQCETARTNALAALARAGAKNVQAGACHHIDAGVGSTRQNAYLYEVSYERTTPVWAGDTNLGKAPAPRLAGAHSFRSNGWYTSKADAVSHEAARVAALRAPAFGAKVTWRSGVKQNVVTKNWEYEIDYDSRVPFTPTNTQMSEKAGVTSPSLGVVNPIPTNATPDASDLDTDAATPGTVVTPPPVVTPDEPTSVAGIDISGHTQVADWAGWKSAGVRFVSIKASEGTYYTNPKFSSQYAGANAAGVIRGAYHFANPSVSTGAEQADYFVNHGGGWSADGTTLPGALDMEWNPYGQMCFGMTTGQMRTWVNDFTTQYEARTGVAPMIYTASIWWNTCVGSDATNTGAPTSSTTTPAPLVTDAMLAANPLWIAQYSTTPGALPATWAQQSKTQAIWQNAEINAKGYDTDIFNGTPTQLKTYAATGRR